jgi:hypothetical protein
VNPLALKAKSDVLATNERQVTRALRHARLRGGRRDVRRQGRPVVHGTTFQRGDEKGDFLFGATVIVLGEPGRWTPDAALLQQTAQQRETLVRLGEPVAARGAR